MKPGDRVWYRQTCRGFRQDVPAIYIGKGGSRVGVELLSISGERQKISVALKNVRPRDREVTVALRDGATASI